MADLTPPPPENFTPVSPRWSVFTKFLLSLVAVVLIGFLLVRFRAMLGPLVLAFILAYLLNPVADWLVHNTRLSWGAAVAVIFLVLLLLIITVLTVAGIAIGQQISGFYDYVVEVLPNLDERVAVLFSQPIHIGPFTLDPTRPIAIGPFVIDFSTVDLRPLYNQLITALQPALSRTGNVVGSLASGTLAFLGWLLFILIISYYLLHDLRNLVPSIEQIVPAGYQYDVRRLAIELGPIWNAFLRGQITLAIVMGLIVGLTLGALGVRYAPVLGLLAGLLEFIPVVGPFVSGAIAVIVALFQPDNWLNMSPLYFALLVLIVQLVLQQLENNFLVPRIIGGSLNLHPIVILVGALIAANLAGITGLLLSAPLIATLRLFGRYVYRKMFDLDPWPEPPPEPTPPPKFEWPRWIVRRRLKAKGTTPGSDKPSVS